MYVRVTVVKISCHISIDNHPTGFQRAQSTSGSTGAYSPATVILPIETVSKLTHSPKPSILVNRFMLNLRQLNRAAGSGLPQTSVAISDVRFAGAGSAVLGNMAELLDHRQDEVYCYGQDDVNIDSVALDQGPAHDSAEGERSR